MIGCILSIGIWIFNDLGDIVSDENSSNLYILFYVSLIFMIVLLFPFKLLSPQYENLFLLKYLNKTKILIINLYYYAFIFFNFC